MKKYLLNVCIYMLVFGGSSLLIADEPWIDYDDISKIELGSNKEDIISSLGEPILMLGSSEYDNTIYLFYNYHVKNYNISTKKSLSDRLSTTDTTNVALNDTTSSTDKGISISNGSTNEKHSKRYDKIRNTKTERSTLIKFTFVDDSLVSWEEDKMTLSMSTAKNGAKNSTFLSYFSLLLNLVLLIKII